MSSEMRLKHLVIGIVAGVFFITVAFAQELSPMSAQEIVAAADKVRNPGQSFRLTNTLIEYDAGQPRNRTTLVVYSSEDKQTGGYNNLVRYIDPARDVGKTVLMNGTDMWFYDPSSKASVRISPQQRLIGQASNGDVVTVNFSKDYTAKLVGSETLKDADHQDRDSWHIDMTPVSDEAVYGRVEYWIEKGTYRPVKGKLYSDSGRLLKIIYYHKYSAVLGGVRPTEVVIIDAVDQNLVTTMIYSEFRNQVIPASWFQRDYLPHLPNQ